MIRNIIIFAIVIGCGENNSLEFPRIQRENGEVLDSSKCELIGSETFGGVIICPTPGGFHCEQDSELFPAVE